MALKLGKIFILVKMFENIYSRLFARPRFKEFNKLLFLLGARGLGILNYHTPWTSGEEPFLKKFLAKYDDSDSVVLDIGANKGQFASWVLRNSSNVKVISFEPNPSSAAILRENIGFNSRHTLINKGASNSVKSGKIYDYDQEIGSGHASMHREVFAEIYHSDTYSEIPIELTTVDHELPTFSTMKVCLLKIDTEGHEKDVLKGSKILLETHSPEAILIEFNEMNAFTNTQYHTVKQLIGNNYTPHRLLPGGSLLPLNGESPLYTEIYAYQNLVFLRSHY